MIAKAEAQAQAEATKMEERLARLGAETRATEAANDERDRLNPPTVERAKELGWQVHIADGRRVIMHWVGADGKRRSKTFILPKALTKKARKECRALLALVK